MPRNRNNDTKEFAIGTKIEYNGKLYEVIESVNCADCSLKTICSNSDEYKYNPNTYMSKDKRINIFGECLSMNRSDSKSVAFAEIPKDSSKDEYYKVIPLWIDDKSIELRPVEFDLPNGYMIDKEHSNLDKGIIKFKNKWLTLEQIYKLAKEEDYLTNRSAIKDFRDGKLTAIANLMDIARYFNGNWNYDATKEAIGYMIAYDASIEAPNYDVRKINACANIYYGNVIFRNKADAEYIINNPNFRIVLDKIFKS